MKRNKFSLSNYHLTSLFQGELVPVGHYEVLPGDTVQQSTSCLVRAAPLVAPVMHPVHARIHHWFVPYRLLHEDWESFITGGPDGDDATVPPYVELSGAVNTASLASYMGVPIGTYTNDLRISALPFRAYALIFNEWYRDQDLVNVRPFTTASGLDTTTDITSMSAVAWEKDYFTSARPDPQKGAAMSVPMTAQATPGADAGLWRGATTGLLMGTGGDVSVDTTTSTGESHVGTPQSAATRAFYDPNGTLAIDVNDLRESLALQRFAEARARFGSRYSEYLRYLGVKSSDARLQRPEYLGGGKQTIQFSEVLQTAEGTNPVGMMRGHGIAAMRSNRWRRFFEEHGIVMTFMSVKPRTIYMQAMNKSWFRYTKEDYWQRELEHIGQQEITSKEVYALTAGPDSVFGYQDRYDEYRRKESMVSGDFADTLKYWHMARDLSGAPTLNSSFVTSNPTSRIYAAPGQPELYCMAMHSIQARRQLSKTGTSFIF